MVVRHFAELLAQRSVRLVLLSASVLSFLLVVWTYRGPFSSSKFSVPDTLKSSLPGSAAAYGPFQAILNSTLGVSYTPPWHLSS